MDTDFAPAHDLFHPQDSGWGLLVHVGEATRRDEARARTEALQMQALMAAQAGDASSACYFLALSLGSEVLPDSAIASLTALELQVALAALPAEVGAALPVWQAEDARSVAELCQQLAISRETGLACRRANDKALLRH